MNVYMNQSYFVDANGNIQWGNVLLLGGLIYVLWGWVKPFGK